jgi:hypothetical protein
VSCLQRLGRMLLQGRYEGCIGEEPVEDTVWVGETGKVFGGAHCTPYNLYNHMLHLQIDPFDDRAGWSGHRPI